jgi:hypothetical protein
MFAEFSKHSLTTCCSQSFRFLFVGVLKSPSAFSSSAKWRETPPHFLCLSCHSHPPRERCDSLWSDPSLPALILVEDILNICCDFWLDKHKELNSFLQTYYSAISHILRWNCFLKQVIEGKIKWEVEVTRRRGRKHKKLLDDLERILLFERGSSRSHYVEEPFWKRR